MSLAWLNTAIDERKTFERAFPEIASECKRRNLEDVNLLAQSGLKLRCVYREMCEFCHLK